MESEDLVVSLIEASKILNLSKSGAYKFIKTHKCKTIKSGNKMFIVKKQLLELKIKYKGE